MIRGPRSANRTRDGQAVVISKEQYDPAWVNYIGNLTGRRIDVIDIDPGPSNPATTEEIIDHIADHLGPRERKRLHFRGYIESRNLAQAARRRGMNAGPSHPDLIETGLTEVLNNKAWLRRVGIAEGDPTTLYSIETEGVEHGWEATVRTLKKHHTAIAQAKVGGGGFPNWYVEQLDNGTYQVRFAFGDPVIDDVEILKEHFTEFVSMAPENRYLLVTPGVTVVSSPSVHFELTDEEITCTGVYEQRLDEKKECIGGRKTNLGPVDQAHKASFIQAAYPSAKRAYRMGKRGHASFDLIESNSDDLPKFIFGNKVIRSPEGNPIAICDPNVRDTSNSEHGTSAEEYATAGGKYPGETTWGVQEVIETKEEAGFNQARTVLDREGLSPDPHAPPHLRIGVFPTNPPTLGNVGLTAAAHGGGPERALQVEHLLEQGVQAMRNHFGVE
jgi:hypothetical protein